MSHAEHGSGGGHTHEGCEGHTHGGYGPRLGGSLTLSLPGAKCNAFSCAGARVCTHAATGTATRMRKWTTRARLTSATRRSTRPSATGTSAHSPSVSEARSAGARLHCSESVFLHNGADAA
jgi:hypothetical protein